MHASNKLINPSTVKLEGCINRDQIEPITVVDAKRMVVSVVFKDSNVWCENLNKLTAVVKHLLRLFVVHNDCVVSLKRLGEKQNFNIVFILVHKTDCKNNNGARVTSNTSVMVMKTMSAIQFYHVEIGLEVQPFFGMEPQVSHLKNIIKAARNGFSPLSNMVIIVILIIKVK